MAAEIIKGLDRDGLTIREAQTRTGAELEHPHSPGSAVVELNKQARSGCVDEGSP